MAELRTTNKPLQKFRASVAKTLGADELDEIDRAARELVDTAVAEARAATYPPVSSLLTDVYRVAY